MLGAAYSPAVSRTGEQPHPFEPGPAPDPGIDSKSEGERSA